MWCRPRSPVEPMYIPGRLRTASRPSRTVMELPEYAFSVFGRATTWGPSVAQSAAAPGAPGTHDVVGPRAQNDAERVAGGIWFPGYRVHRQECRRPRPDVVSAPLPARQPPPV